MSRVPAPADRCVARADRRGDPMLGTAFPAARLLLVEEPFPWGPEGLRTSRFDRQTALALEARGRAEGVRVQAIRRVGRSRRDHPRRWALIDTRQDRQSVRWGHFEQDPELMELALDGSTGEPAPDWALPFYLVCTHGKHDPCCGQRGRPIAAALAELVPDRVWQTSHLGGCRFSPTVLVLPAGVMYGRVSPSAAEELVRVTEAGEILGSCLRGRIGMRPAAQAALGYAHQRLGLVALSDASVLGMESLGGSEVRVTVRTPHGDHAVTVAQDRIDAEALTCGSPGPSWFQAHRLVDIVAL